MLCKFSRRWMRKKITVPCDVRKELNIKPGDRLELTLGGINKTQKLLISKPKGR